MKLLFFLLTFTLFGQLFPKSEMASSSNISTINFEQNIDNKFYINKNNLSIEYQNTESIHQLNRESPFQFNLFRVSIIFICIGSIMGVIGFCMLFAALARRKKLGRKIKEVRADVAKLPKTQIDRYVNLNEILVGLETQEKALKDKNPKKLEEVQAKIQALKKEIDEMKAAAK